MTLFVMLGLGCVFGLPFLARPLAQWIAVSLCLALCQFVPPAAKAQEGALCVVRHLLARLHPGFIACTCMQLHCFAHSHRDGRVPTVTLNTINLLLNLENLNPRLRGCLRRWRAAGGAAMASRPHPPTPSTTSWTCRASGATRSRAVPGAVPSGKTQLAVGVGWGLGGCGRAAAGWDIGETAWDP